MIDQYFKLGDEVTFSWEKGDWSGWGIGIIEAINGKNFIVKCGTEIYILSKENLSK